MDHLPQLQDESRNMTEFVFVPRPQHIRHVCDYVDRKMWISRLSSVLCVRSRCFDLYFKEPSHTQVVSFEVNKPYNLAALIAWHFSQSRQSRILAFIANWLWLHWFHHLCIKLKVKFMWRKIIRRRKVISGHFSTEQV